MAQGAASLSPIEPDPAGKATPAPGASRPVQARPFPPVTAVLPETGWQKIVPLFAEQAATDDDPPADWPSALQLIRDVGAQVRRERDLAQEIVHHSQSLIQRSVTQAEDAERRAETAEAGASEASSRADRAEAQARLAEERAEAAERRAEAAEAREQEARLWLRRLHAGLKSEFDSLTIGVK